MRDISMGIRPTASRKNQHVAPSDSKWRGAVGGVRLERPASAMSLDDGRADALAVAVPREPLLPLAVSVNRRCTTLCPVMDAWLRGGVPTRSLTEFAGEAGSAKTQIALQLLLGAQLPASAGGLDGAAVYVHTEGRAPLARLRQIVARHPTVSRNLPHDHDPLDHVYLVKTLDDPEGLWNALASVADLLRDPPGGAERPVRLLVVDSVSSPFRETDAARREGAVERAGALGRVAALLREYAHKHDLAVVLTNHVVDAVAPDQRKSAGFAAGGTTAPGSAPGPGTGTGSHDFFGPRQRRLFGAAGDVRSSGRAVAPSLGLFWANCVNTRVFLSRTGGSAGGFGGGEGVGGGGVVGGVRRTARIVFSAHLPVAAGWGDGVGPPPCDFEVREDGTWGIARAEDEDERA